MSVISDAPEQSDLLKPLLRHSKCSLRHLSLKVRQNKEGKEKREWPQAEPLPWRGLICEHPYLPEDVYTPESFKEMCLILICTRSSVSQNRFSSSYYIIFFFLIHIPAHRIFLIWSTVFSTELLFKTGFMTNILATNITITLQMSLLWLIPMNCS